MFSSSARKNKEAEKKFILKIGKKLEARYAINERSDRKPEWQIIAGECFAFHTRSHVTEKSTGEEGGPIVDLPF